MDGSISLHDGTLQTIKPVEELETKLIDESSIDAEYRQVRVNEREFISWALPVLLINIPSVLQYVSAQPCFGEDSGSGSVI